MFCMHMLLSGHLLTRNIAVVYSRVSWNFGRMHVFVCVWYIHVTRWLLRADRFFIRIFFSNIVWNPAPFSHTVRNILLLFLLSECFVLILLCVASLFSSINCFVLDGWLAASRFEFLLLSLFHLSCVVFSNIFHFFYWTSSKNRHKWFEHSKPTNLTHHIEC